MTGREVRIPPVDRPPGAYRRGVVGLGTSQLGLFGGGSLAFDPTFVSAVRTDLDEHSWVEHVPGWLQGSEDLLARLAAVDGWEQRERWMFDRMVDEPRLTIDFPDIADAPEPYLRTVADALSARYGVAYDGLWINLYRDERDSTGWHGDPALRRSGTAIVPVLSLGATRRFLLRPKDGGPSHVMTPAGGDLIVMGGRCQVEWRHCVPKRTAHTGARISVNFQSRAQDRR